MTHICLLPNSFTGQHTASQLLVAERECREGGAAGVHMGACVCRGSEASSDGLTLLLPLIASCKSGRRIIRVIPWRHWRWGFLGSTKQVCQNPCPGAHSCMRSLQTGKGFLLAFFESVRVLSCVRLVALIFQQDLFFFHCLGAALAEQMNQIMLLNQSRANAVSRYYLIAWS